MICHMSIWGFRRTDWVTKQQVLYEKAEGKYLPVQTKQTGLISCLLYCMTSSFGSVLIINTVLDFSIYGVNPVYTGFITICCVFT